MIQGIITKIIEDSTCQTLIGQSGSTYKVYPIVAPQDTTKPYVTIRRTGEFGANVKNSASEVDQLTVNITAYDERYKVCVDILEAIRTVLENFKGTQDGIVYKNIWYANSQDLFDKEDNSCVVVDTYNARVGR